MKKTASLLLPVLLIATIIISHVACGDPSSKIIGQWKLENIVFKGGMGPAGGELTGEREKKIKEMFLKDSMLEFYKDKSFIISLAGKRFSGNWIYLEDGRIKLTYTDREADIAKIEGDKIKIKSPSEVYFGDSVFIFTR